MTDFDSLFIDNREKGGNQLRQCQLVMLRMLKILDYLCEKHQIEYFLVGGSMLGAVRHQGFIPWDDDLDVGMTRENYKKFTRKAVPELPNDIFFQTPETDPHYPSCDFVEAKLRDKYSNYNINKYKYHDGIQLDIFVYDQAFLPHNFFIYMTNYCLKLLKNNRRRAKILETVKAWTPIKLVYASSYISWFKAIKIGKNFIKPVELSTLHKVKFEDMETYIPCGWDACLERQYGEYMKLPPLEQQEGHHDLLPNPFVPCNHTEILQWRMTRTIKGIVYKAKPINQHL
jgi:lipopolysaccharide cholinephosphotransferase